MGLDWAKIREEYAKKATPKELESPFREDGQLKESALKRIKPSDKPRNTPIVPEEVTKSGRASRAKAAPKTRKEAGAMASKPRKIQPEVREHCARLYRQGKNFSQIGRLAGVHPTTAKKVLVEDGVHKPEESLGMRGRDQ